MDSDWELGQAAQARGFVTALDVLACLNVQVRAEAALGKHFELGDILFLRGHLDEDQHAALVKDEIPGEGSKRGPLLGEALLARGLVTPEALLRALTVQRQEIQSGRGRRPIGEILIEERAVAPDELAATLRMVQARPGGATQRIDTTAG